MNSVNLIGRLAKDPELKHTNDNKPVCGFCIAIDAGKDRAYFIDCVAWGDKAEQIAQNFRKGNKIGISGKLTTRMYEYEGKNRKSTEVLVDTYDYCTDKKANDDTVPFSI